MATSFVLSESCLLKQLVKFFVELTDWNQLLPLKIFVWVEILHFCLLSWTLLVQYPNNWSNLRSKKLVQISLDICQNPHSRCRCCRPFQVHLCCLERREEDKHLYFREKCEIMFFGKSKLVMIANVIRYDLFFWQDFQLWKIPTISIDLD